MHNHRLLSWQSTNRHMLGALVILMCCLIDGSALTAQAQSAPHDGEQLSFEYVEEELICAKVRILDEEVIFAIDTGASHTLLDTRFQNRLGQRLDEAKLTQTLAGSIAVPCYRAPAMRITAGEFEIALTVPFVGVVDLGTVRAGFDQPVAGMIGMDFLKNYVLRLSFDDRYAALVRTPRDISAEIKHINFDKLGIPTVRVSVPDDQFYEVKLDSGAVAGLKLESAVFAKLKKKGRIVVDGGLLVGALGGFADARPGILDRVELGNIRLRNVDVSSSQMNLMGLKVFERFEAEFDFPNRKAYFRPGKCVHDPPRTNLSHFGVKIVNDKLVVLGCRGIAQDAGMRVDDVLVKVNGRPAREMTISAFRRLQCQPDTELNLRFERESDWFDVSLKLKQPPNPFPDKIEDSKDLLTN